MNLDEAIEMYKKLEEEYGKGWISLYSPVSKQFHLDDEKFKELASNQTVYTVKHSDEYDQQYFYHKDYKFFRLVEREGGSK